MYKISEQLAIILKGMEFTEGNFFNPIQDKDGVWFISEQEYEKATIESAKEQLKAIDKVKDKVAKETYKAKEIKIE